MDSASWKICVFNCYERSNQEGHGSGVNRACSSWNTWVNSQVWMGGVTQALLLPVELLATDDFGSIGVIIFGCVPTKLHWIIPGSWALSQSWLELSGSQNKTKRHNMEKGPIGRRGSEQEWERNERLGHGSNQNTLYTYMKWIVKGQMYLILRSSVILKLFGSDFPTQK